MPINIDKHNPQFNLLPTNNNRTAWKPAQAPIILSVPHTKDKYGRPIENSQINNIQIYIENTPRQSLVAGHDHVGMKRPDKELYSETITLSQLLERIISPTQYPIYSPEGEEIDPENIDDGDYFEYTSINGIIERIQYYKSAEYYDLSDISIEVITLPHGHYNLVYEANYYQRVTSSDDQLLCIQDNQELSLYKFPIKHPGDIIDNFYKNTPAIYLTDENQDKDTTVELYRPFTDILQDIADEQDLLERINWVFDTPAEIVPYMSTLLGWDLPYFPRSLDRLRKAVLRETVKFQNLKGSKQAVYELFKLFGFKIYINNLWWSKDGLKLIRPNETLSQEYRDQEITSEELYQVDALLSEWNVPKSEFQQAGTTPNIVIDSGYANLTLPLLYRPQQEYILGIKEIENNGPVTIDAYLVEENSDGDLELQEIIETLKEEYSTWGSTTANCLEDSDGFINPQELHTRMASHQLTGYSQILFEGDNEYATKEVLVGTQPPITKSNVTFDRNNNKINLITNGYISVGYKLYIFATYKRVKLNVPQELQQLHSNRFDIQIIKNSTNEYIDPITLEFALEFLTRIKAFHSLLYLIRYSVDLKEVYQVTDVCGGFDLIQRYDTDFGSLQVPPAITPTLNSNLGCLQADPTNLGYKETDLAYRQNVIDKLKEEYEAWKRLDDRQYYQSDLSNPDSGRSTAKYNPYGQDKVINENLEQIKEYTLTPNNYANSHVIGSASNLNLQKTGTTNNDTNYIASGSSYSSPIGNIPTDLDDFCYKGRVNDVLKVGQFLNTAEIYNSRACRYSIGSGIYWTYPIYPIVVVPGTQRPTCGSKTEKTIYSQTTENQVVTNYLNNDKNSYLSRLYRAYGGDHQSLHYSNRRYEIDISPKKNLALYRPSLNIDIPTLHLPGCRFPGLYALKEDYTSIWDARPWDKTVTCATDNGKYLNPTLVISDNGDSYLEFDVQSYFLTGNGYEPDISSLGTQVVQDHYSEEDVVHAVFSSNATGHPAITLDQTDPFDTSVDIDGTKTVSNAIFSSAGNCYSNPVDFADGYASNSGFQTSDGVTYEYSEALEGIGLPVSNATSIESLFLLGSGIRNNTGFRLDCGCLYIDCGQTGIDCAVLDNWEPDLVEADSELHMPESLGCYNHLLDGSTILSLLET